MDSTGLSHKVHICSVNNFPTAAGLASSAAGFACLGKCQNNFITSLTCFFRRIRHNSSQMMLPVCVFYVLFHIPHFAHSLLLLLPLIMCCSLHSGPGIRCRRGVVWDCSAGLRQRMPEYVWRVCPVAHGTAGRWQGQFGPAGGARDSLA